MNDLISFLNSINPLSKELQQYLADTLTLRELRKKEYLLKAGHISRNICFIKQGLLRCFYNKGHREVCSWIMKEGDVIASVESFFQQKESHEYIQAIEDCRLYSLSYSQLEHIYRHYPEFNFVARLLLQHYYILSEQRLYSLRMQRSQERYDYLMQHHPEWILRVPAKFIASYLGITDETLSRIRAKR